MKHNINCLLLLSIFFGFQLTPLLKAQEHNREKINRDIKTMEKILDKIMYKDSAHKRFSPHNTKGVYIPEFGLIFHIQQNPYEQLRVKIFNNRMEHLKKQKSSFDTSNVQNKNRLVKIQEGMKSFQSDNDKNILDSFVTKKNTAESKEEIVQNLKNNIFIFHKKYTSSLRNLNNNDKIALIIDFDNWGGPKTNNLFLTSQITYRTLNQYREQKINDEDLKKSITYSVSEPNRDINSSIEIMNEIINENLNKSQPFHRPLYNNGFYFSNFGVIFFLEIPEYMFSPYKYKDFFNKYMHKNQEQAHNKKSDDEVNLKNKISDLKDNIFNILASYGHTLQVNPDEYIIMNIDLGDKIFGLSADQPTAFTMKIKKKYLDSYYHGNLSKDNLQKKFGINSYSP
ncbi:MAG: hypothetical protein R6V04_03745 [bacterium]